MSERPNDALIDSTTNAELSALAQSELRKAPTKRDPDILTVVRNFASAVRSRVKGRVAQITEEVPDWDTCLREIIEEVITEKAEDNKRRRGASKGGRVVKDRFKSGRRGRAGGGAND